MWVILMHKRSIKGASLLAMQAPILLDNFCSFRVWRAKTRRGSVPKHSDKDGIGAFTPACMKAYGLGCRAWGTEV